MKSTRRWQQLLLNSLAIILGNALYSLAVALFLEPAGLITGGATGIALAFGRLTGLSVSGFLFLFNMSMLAWGWAVLGKKFALNTLASSVLSPAFLALFERLLPGICLTANPMLCTLFGGLGIGAGLGIVIRSGASTGGHEACEKRDRDPSRYGGKGVRSAVHAVNDELARALIGRDAAEQKTIDRILCETDGTGDKSNLGANAILGVSLAVAHAAAAACRLPLWQYLTRFTGRRPALPRPMMNILNGGRHAPNNIDIQEFMVIPLGCPTFADGLERCVRVTHRLGALLEEAGLACGVGDEGGFAPRLKNEEQALELILRAIEDCRLRPGEDMALALDAAAGEWQTGNNMYLLPKENRLRTPHDLLEYWRRLTAKYPIISLEDPAGEDDWDLWRQLTEAIGKNVQLVGDDLFVTQKARLEQGLARRAANAVLIKPNQVGTLTETLETVALAQQSGYGAILSHRSGETEDTTIADLAVATACGQIKTGAPCRSERTAKYNRLLRIEAMLEEMV